MPRETRWIPALLAIVLNVGCFSSQPWTGLGPMAQGAGSGEKERQALGSFTVASDRVGDATVTPFGCEAGGRQHFLGADFPDERSGVVVRLVVDPLDGPAVRVFATDARFEKTFVFRRAECRTFHFSLSSTGWRINDIEDYKLSLEVDCERSGESVRGQLSTTHCH